MDRILRMFINQLINRGLRKGIDHVSRGGKDRQAMTPEERRQAQTSRKRMTQASRLAQMLRRIGR